MRADFEIEAPFVVGQWVHNPSKRGATGIITGLVTKVTKSKVHVWWETGAKDQFSILEAKAKLKGVQK